MDELVTALKQMFANSFAFYLKAHNYHWNVEGPDFKQYHDLFGGIYEEVYGSLDTAAEYIRTLDSYAPGSFSRFAQLSEIEDETKVPTSRVMFERLLADNETLLASIKKAYDLAEAAGDHGLSNFLAERQAAQKKHAWMIRATLKNR